MASPSTSSAPAVPPKYEYLKSLSDIQSTRDLTEDAIRDILRNHTNDYGLDVVSMDDIQDMSGLNDAFNSTICSLRAVIKFSGDENEKEYNFVIKSPPKMSFIRMVHKLSRPFFNEVTWYLDLVPQLDLALGKKALDGILPTCFHAYSSYYAGNEGEGTFCTNRFPWYCWLPCKKAESGVLILENVKLREGVSYSMYDKRKPLPLEHIMLIFKEIAHFHGKWLKWIALNKNGKLKKKDFEEDSSSSTPEPLSFRTFESICNTQRRIPKILYNKLTNIAKKTVIKVLKKRGAEEEENIAKCREFFDRTAMRLLRAYMKQPLSEVSTLCHGDFWSNNILFSYENDDVEKKNPKDLIMIDFQLINYGHPCYDLVYFIYINTDMAFREAHLNDVLKTYFDIYSSYIAEALPSTFSYSFDDFINDFNMHKPIGFSTACSVMPNVMSDCQVDLENTGFFAFNELQRKQEQELDDDNNAASIEIRRRIVDMVHEMARDGVI